MLKEKAEQAVRELYQIESLRSDVGRLECSLRESRAEVDELRYELQACLERLGRLEQNPNA